MITFKEARQRVDRRIAPLAERNLPVHQAALLCAGTDVNGPELARELLHATAEAVIFLRRGDRFGEMMNGMLVRSFWLGYEIGREVER